MLGRILLTGLLAATMIFAQGKKGGGGGRGPNLPDGNFGATSRLDRISDALKLSKDQKKDLKTTFDDAQKEATPVHDQLSKARTVIADAVAAGKSQDDIAKACAAEAQLEAQMVGIEMRAFTKFATGLEADQRTRAPMLFQMMHGLFNGKNWNEAQ